MTKQYFSSYFYHLENNHKYLSLKKKNYSPYQLLYFWFIKQRSADQMVNKATQYAPAQVNEKYLAPLKSSDSECHSAFFDKNI
jgi:hypothetical protein